VQPGLEPRRREEVRHDEHEAPRREVCAQARELVERALDVVLGRVELEQGEPLFDLPAATTPSRREPERSAFALLAARVVEVPDLAARGERADDDRVRDRGDCSGLGQPRELGRVEGHRRPAVAQDDDARRFLRVLLADDEHVAAARRRQAGGRIPVDLRDGIPRPVLARARHVGARPTPEAALLAERDSRHAPARHERKGPARRLAHPSTARGAVRSSSQSGSGRGATARQRSRI